MMKAERCISRESKSNEGRGEEGRREKTQGGGGSRLMKTVALDI